MKVAAPSDNLMANFGFAFHQLSAQIVNGQSVAPIGISEELKSAVAAEVRAQMVPVMKEIVREVVNEVRGVVTDVVTPLYDELREFRNRIRFPNTLLYSAGNMAMYTNGSSSFCDVVVSLIRCSFFVFAITLLKFVINLLHFFSLFLDFLSQYFHDCK